VAIAFIAGIAYAAIAIPAQTELQETIPEDVRGRVFGILNTLVSIGSFLPIIMVGLVSEAVGPAPVLLGAAGLVGLSGVGSILLRGRQQRMALPGVEEGLSVPGPSPDEP
jgi:MFS family permease